jgi:beta-glucosidase
MLAINAGLDMDMQGSIYLNKLKDLVKSGKVSEETINNSVRNVLVAKYKLGLFEDPYRYCSLEREAKEIMTPDNLAFAREFASKSAVLLKNSNKTLPIKRNIRTLAVIGPLGDSKADMLGSWSAAGQADKCVTLLEGLKNKLDNKTRIIYSKGCETDSYKTDGFAEALRVARQADFVILALGENSGMSGEAASRTDPGLPGVQLDLARMVINSGVSTAVVLFNGRPLTIEELDNIAPALLEVWFGGTEAGDGISDLLFGDVIPSGKLTITFPRNLGQIPIFYNVKNTGRPIDPLSPEDKYKSRYLDCPNTPLYPFGYGLSYTTFRYSNLSMQKTSFSKGEDIEVSTEVANTGEYDGDEIVQLYVHQKVGDVTRPLKELKGFKKVSIKKGESVKLSFILKMDELSYYHQNMSYNYDGGDYDLYIGPNSSEGLSTSFRIL